MQRHPHSSVQEQNQTDEVDMSIKLEDTDEPLDSHRQQ